MVRGEAFDTMENDIIEQPAEDLCWPCGAAVEAWPLLSKEDVIHKLSSERIFSIDFNNVRRGAVAAMDSLKKHSFSISAGKGLVDRLIVRDAFVELRWPLQA